MVRANKQSADSANGSNNIATGATAAGATLVAVVAFVIWKRRAGPSTMQTAGTATSSGSDMELDQTPAAAVDAALHEAGAHNAL